MGQNNPAIKQALEVTKGKTPAEIESYAKNMMQSKGIKF